jgi:hypothetical protein
MFGSLLHLSCLVRYPLPEFFVLGPLYVDCFEELVWLHQIKFLILASLARERSPLLAAAYVESGSTIA